MQRLHGALRRDFGADRGADGAFPFATRVAHAIECAAGFSPARDEIHRAVAAEFDVGDVQRTALQERLESARGRRAARFQMHGEDTAESPIEREQGASIPLGEGARRSELHAGRRPQAHIHHRRQRVGVIGWPLARSLAEAVFAAADHMQNAGGNIPGEAIAVFGIAIEGEQLAARVEGQVIDVAEAAREQFHVSTVGIHAEDETGRSLALITAAHTVVCGGKQLVFAIVLEGRTRRRILRRQDMIPLNQVDAPIRSEHQTMRTVLTVDLPFRLPQQLDFVIGVDTLRVAQPVQAQPLRPLPRSHRGYRKRRAVPWPRSTGTSSFSTRAGFPSSGNVTRSIGSRPCGEMTSRPRGSTVIADHEPSPGPAARTCSASNPGATLERNKARRRRFGAGEPRARRPGEDRRV